MNYLNSEEWAKKADEADELKAYRKQFLIPQHEGEDTVYFTGNSLGLQPVTARAALDQELNDWAQYGVEGHFDAKNPWFSYHEMFAEPMSKLVGAHPYEVVAMNGLTTNLHLLMVSFYQPTPKKYKILCEAKAFPSDQYALESQVRFHGFKPEDAIIEVAPREGEHTLRNEDIIAAIEDNKDELALVLFGGVNYYTGQKLDMQAITAKAKENGLTIGWDLAHGVGNVELHLHDWEVDFAAWCSYKYMNAGPGSISGVFIHEKHVKNTDLIRFAGWWGHDKSSRFLMEKGFVPMQTAEAWQLSNAPVLAMAVYKASLDIFMDAGFDKLREKSEKLTGYLEFVLSELSKEVEGVNFEVITPALPKDRGAQLSILCHGAGRELFDAITKKGVIADWREPNVIRVAPVPLYNSFTDVYRFGKIMRESV